jgi:hypothetical protein
MPRFSNAVIRSLSSLNSSSGSSPESNPTDLATQQRILTRRAADTLAQLHQARNQSSDDHLTNEERDEFVEENFGQAANNDDDEDDEDDEEDDDEEEDGNVNGVTTDTLVASIFKAHIVDKTRGGYQRSQKKFAIWVFKQTQMTDHSHLTRFRQMMNDDFYQAMIDESRRNPPKLEKIAKQYIQRASDRFHPLKLGLLKAEDFVAFLLSFSPSGTYKSKSTYGGARAALFDLFRVCKIKQSEEFKSDLKQAYGGLERKAQDFKQQTNNKQVLV